MNPFNKSLNLIMLSVGMAIFSTVVLIKVDVMAKKSKADFQLLLAEKRWEDHTVMEEVRENKKQNF